jgi:aspartate/methionine/tyrosine aminotransferase
MSQLPPFRLETYFSRWEFSARYHLTASDAVSMSMAELVELADEADRRAWDTLWLGYTPTYGDPVLREAVAACYQRASPDHVVCFAGAEEGLYLAMQVLLGAADHAVVITPNYQSAETIPLSLCSVTGVALNPADDWALDVDAVAAAIRPNTKVISVNFPNNPTGKVIDAADFTRLAALCDEHDIHLFSDEVFRGLERDPARTLPNATDLSEQALSLNVTSKSLGLPGLRIGWIVCRDRAVVRNLELAKHYTTICNAAPSELLARIALKARSQILQRNRALIAANIEIFDAFFADHADLFEWQAPDGGCVAFPRYLGDAGAESFCRTLVEQTGVLLLPPSVFESQLTATARDRFRIGVGRSDPGEALDVLDKWLNNR